MIVEGLVWQRLEWDDLRHQGLRGLEKGLLNADDIDALLVIVCRPVTGTSAGGGVADGLQAAGRWPRRRSYIPRT